MTHSSKPVKHRHVTPITPRGPRGRHLGIRFSEEEWVEMLRRLPQDTATSDWARCLLLGQPLHRERPVRLNNYRDTTPYVARLRQDALLSVASSLSRLAGRPLDQRALTNLEQTLGLVRAIILKDFSQ